MVLKIIASSSLGFLFGWAMEKAKVYEPQAIHDQMLFKRFLMMKMFLSALATSTLSLIILKVFFRSKYNKMFEGYRDALRNKSYVMLIVGGSCIGLGMQVSGACPGMVLVQLGAGVPMALVTFGGALAGALVHGVLNGQIMRLSAPNLELSAALFERFSMPANVSRGLMVAALAAGVYAMETALPWTSEYPNSSGPTFWLSRAWSPALCGALLGSIQLFSVLFLERSLGTSSCYSTIAGVPCVTKDLQQRFPYLARFRSGASNWLTVLFMSSAVVGGFVSSYTSGVYGKSVGTDSTRAFIGGFLMVFGARTAGGCTSGHGISGCSYQFMGSFLTTASMFASAIGYAHYSR